MDARNAPVLGRRRSRGLSARGAPPAPSQRAPQPPFTPPPPTMRRPRLLERGSGNPSWFPLFSWLRLPVALSPPPAVSPSSAREAPSPSRPFPAPTSPMPFQASSRSVRRRWRASRGSASVRLSTSSWGQRQRKQRSSSTADGHIPAHHGRFLDTRGAQSFRYRARIGSMCLSNQCERGHTWNAELATRLVQAAQSKRSRSRARALSRASMITIEPTLNALLPCDLKARMPR